MEDAIRLNILKRSEIPESVTKILGNTNGTIVYHLVTDIIRNSFEKESVSFSEEVSNALKRLKAFNLERIYMNPNIKQQSAKIKRMFEYLFNRFSNDHEEENFSSRIFTGFLENKSDDYLLKHKPAEIVRDFVAGMTDQYFINLCPESLRPEPYADGK